MRSIIAVCACGVIVLSVLVACGRGIGDEAKDSTYAWRIIKSPITGKCYEVADRQEGYSGFMGMDDVPCTYYTGEWEGKP